VVRALYAKGVDNRSYQRLKTASESDSRGAEAVALLDALAGALPATYTVYEQSPVAGTINQRTETIDQRNYLAFKDYRGALASSLDTLDRAMKPGTEIKIDLGAGKSVMVKPKSKRWAQLQAERDEFQKLLASPEVRAAHERACIRAGSEYLRLVVADSTGR
jgi:antitoxin component of MazEF toxin-antitoxin module